MKPTWRFRIEVLVETIHAEGFAADKWFRFFTAYRGLESVDPNWPEQGSSVALRYAVVG